MAFVGFIWLLWPMAALGIFLLGTAWHFGDTDQATWKLRMPPWAAFLYGLSLIIWLFACHLSETLVYLKDLGLQEYLQDFSTRGWDLASIGHNGQLLSIGGLLAVIIFSDLKHSVYALIQIAIVFFLFWYLPLLVGFGLYFGVWHSLHTLLTIKIYLDKSPKQMLKLAAPYLALSIAGSIALIFGLNVAGYNSVLVLFIFISALTLPHSLVMHKLFARG
jgi:Brp/Blh family beta-carotene 15,15'-monooxygenase